MRLNQFDPTATAVAAWTPRNQTRQASDAPGPLDLHKLMQVLRWRMRMIAAVAAVTVALAGAALVVLPAKYKAVTVVLVDPRQPRVTASERCCRESARMPQRSKARSSSSSRPHWPSG